MPNTNRESPGRTTRDESIGVIPQHRSLWFAAIAVSLLFVLALSTIAAGGPTEAAVADERVERFYFPIPNATQEEVILNSTSNAMYVFGTVSCGAGEIVEVRVNVTQNSTGAVATGRTAAYCLGASFVQGWVALAEPHSGPTFEAGEVDVAVWARTQVDGETTDTITWDNDGTLIIRGNSDDSSGSTQTATGTTEEANTSYATAL